MFEAQLCGRAAAQLRVPHRLADDSRLLEGCHALQAAPDPTLHPGPGRAARPALEVGGEELDRGASFIVLRAVATLARRASPASVSRISSRTSRRSCVASGSAAARASLARQ